MDLTNGNDVVGISTCNTPCDTAVDAAPCRKRRGNGVPTTDVSAGFKIEFEGVNGYVYSVKYHDGRVTLCVGPCAGVSFLDVEARSGCMSVKDWKLFCSVVCQDLDQPDFPEILYVSQWISATGPEIYCIEADLFIRPSD